MSSGNQWLIDWVFAGLILSALKLDQLTFFTCSDYAFLEILRKYVVRKGILGLYSYAMHKDTVTNDAIRVAIDRLRHYSSF